MSSLEMIYPLMVFALLLSTCLPVSILNKNFGGTLPFAQWSERQTSDASHCALNEN